MPDSSKIEQVKELLASGQTEAAADLLLVLSKGAEKEHYHAALLVKNRVETLQHRVIEGVLSQSEERVEWARVSKAIMELVTQVERGERPQAEDKIVPPAVKEKPKPGLKIWLIALPLVFLLGVFLVPKIFQQPPAEKTNSEKTKTEKPTADLPNSKPRTLIGRVTTPYEKAVTGAQVTFEGFGKSLEAKTDNEGRFEISAPEFMVGQQVELTIAKNGKKGIDKKSITLSSSRLLILKYNE